MSDERLRAAQRNYSGEPTRTNWIALLRESLRAGEPLFTRDGLYDALRWSSTQNAPCNLDDVHPGFNVTNYRDTPDGFVAEVSEAPNPPVHAEYRYPTGGGDYDSISLPAWDRWSGQITLHYPEDEDCPGVDIDVREAADQNFDPDVGPPYYQHHVDYWIYEGGCVIDQASLIQALTDEQHWTT